tara:strand:+ start:163 stop:630 length:468 start_codon:yes stop_codon:yes gene_type:complete
MVEDAPPVLMSFGDTVHLIQPAIVIVSKRDASTSKRWFTGTLATELVAAGHVAVSGMARDNDTPAHIAAVPFGTAAVLASGVGIVYLRENEDLRAHIIECGTVVSAMPVGVTPQGRHFPRPNRIISSFSRTVIVVEAAERSNSTTTAHSAGELGK